MDMAAVENLPHEKLIALIIKDTRAAEDEHLNSGSTSSGTSSLSPASIPSYTGGSLGFESEVSISGTQTENSETNSQSSGSRPDSRENRPPLCTEGIPLEI